MTRCGYGIECYEKVTIRWKGRKVHFVRSDSDCSTSSSSSDSDVSTFPSDCLVYADGSSAAYRPTGCIRQPTSKICYFCQTVHGDGDEECQHYGVDLLVTTGQFEERGYNASPERTVLTDAAPTDSDSWAETTAWHPAPDTPLANQVNELRLQIGERTVRPDGHLHGRVCFDTEKAVDLSKLVLNLNQTFVHTDSTGRLCELTGMDSQELTLLEDRTGQRKRAKVIDSRDFEVTSDNVLNRRIQLPPGRHEIRFSIRVPEDELHSFTYVSPKDGSAVINHYSLAATAQMNGVTESTDRLTFQVLSVCNSQGSIGLLDSNNFVCIPKKVLRRTDGLSFALAQTTDGYYPQYESIQAVVLRRTRFPSTGEEEEVRVTPTLTLLPHSSPNSSSVIKEYKRATPRAKIPPKFTQVFELHGDGDEECQHYGVDLLVTTGQFEERGYNASPERTVLTDAAPTDSDSWAETTAWHPAPDTPLANQVNELRLQIGERTVRPDGHLHGRVCFDTEKAVDLSKLVLNLNQTFVHTDSTGRLCELTGMDSQELTLLEDRTGQRKRAKVIDSRDFEVTSDNVLNRRIQLPPGRHEIRFSIRVPEDELHSFTYVSPKDGSAVINHYSLAATAQMNGVTESTDRLTFQVLSVCNSQGSIGLLDSNNFVCIPKKVLRRTDGLSFALAQTTDGYYPQYESIQAVVLRRTRFPSTGEEEEVRVTPTLTLLPHSSPNSSSVIKEYKRATPRAKIPPKFTQVFECKNLKLTPQTPSVWCEDFLCDYYLRIDADGTAYEAPFAIVDDNESEPSTYYLNPETVNATRFKIVSQQF
ncbi:hypothetical protein AAHC03_024313 [Spirometra sp. Aus1]